MVFEISCPSFRHSRLLAKRMEKLLSLSGAEYKSQWFSDKISIKEGVDEYIFTPKKIITWNFS